MKTHSPKKEEIRREWYFFDAKEEILGRLATRVAQVLMGKQKPYFVRHLDCGDFAVVVNADKVKVSGKKEKQKNYYHHSGYSGGLKITPLGKMRQVHPERIIEHAVAGMLPDNKLKKGMMKRLKIFVGEEHPHKEKFKNF